MFMIDSPTAASRYSYFPSLDGRVKACSTNHSHLTSPISEGVRMTLRSPSDKGEEFLLETWLETPLKKISPSVHESRTDTENTEKSPLVPLFQGGIRGISYSSVSVFELFGRASSEASPQTAKMSSGSRRNPQIWNRF